MRNGVTGTICIAQFCLARPTAASLRNISHWISKAMDYMVREGRDARNIVLKMFVNCIAKKKKEAAQMASTIIKLVEVLTGCVEKRYLWKNNQ